MSFQGMIIPPARFLKGEAVLKLPNYLFGIFLLFLENPHEKLASNIKVKILKKKKRSYAVFNIN